MRRRSLICAIAFLFAVGHIAGGTQRSKHEESPQASNGSGWFDGDKVRVNLKSKEADTDLTYTAEVNEEGDARFEITGREGGKKVAGIILVIGRRAMCTTGLELEKGAEIDALDAAKLAVQMALSLLSKAFPKGSASVRTQTSIELVQRMDAIVMETQSARGELPTPWSLRGSANRVGSQIVGFHLSCSYPMDEGGNKKETLELSGTWEISSASLLLSDDLQLRGWQIYSLGPVTSRTTQGTIYDYGALRMNDFANLGELRRAIMNQPDGKKSPSMRTPGV
jgi:hypothetical protein